MNAVQKIAIDLPPFGENSPVGAPEPDTDDEGMTLAYLCIVETRTNLIWLFYSPTANNDDSEDSESHDEEEEDDLEAMETNQTVNANIAATTDTTTYSAPEF